MNYILLNRNNVVMDILQGAIRYIKLQSNSGIVVACNEQEGTGVIGSDSNTHYTLIRADSSNNPNAVYVLQLEEIPPEATPLKSKYNALNGLFEPRYTLEELKSQKQEANKEAFAAYLASHPMVWVDGKEYGVTQEDQSEISLNLNQYQIAVAAGVEAPVLEWHARHEECQPWQVDALTQLSLSITAVVYPVYHKMQQYKTAIYAAEDSAELDAIVIDYEEAE